MMSETLGLTQLGSVAEYPIGQLKRQLVGKLPGFQVQELDPFLEVAEAYDPSRDQYHSTGVLVILEDLVQTANVNFLLGVAPFDLYVPGMNYVFGEARCPGRVAVISTCRLKSTNDSNLTLLGDRVVKEAVHETGHMLGLRHCSDESCVMHFSERLADTDRKRGDFCSECRSGLRWVEVE
jgi:archaemetzincin